eukprot:scaffold71854_cov58-Cyclotella_meneghiniana.AAC.1
MGNGDPEPTLSPIMTQKSACGVSLFIIIVRSEKTLLQQYSHAAVIPILPMQRSKHPNLQVIIPVPTHDYITQKSACGDN